MTLQTGQACDDIPSDALIEVLASLILALLGALLSTDAMVPLLSAAGTERPRFAFICAVRICLVFVAYVVLIAGVRCCFALLQWHDF